MKKSISLRQTVALIAAIGKYTTVLAQGEMGIGKSAMLTMLGEQFPDHHLCYVDITTKDLGDFVIPKIRSIDGTEVCAFIPNEEFGFHFKKPVIIMLDELGKAKGGVLNACLRLMYERALGVNKLPEGSIVFATTNLAKEGLGDNIPPHARNRITTVRVAKPSAKAWIEYAIDNGVDPVIIATVNEYPMMLASYEEFEDHTQNPYIFHPNAQRSSFVSPRSLVTASRIYQNTRSLGNDVLQAALLGAVGEAATANIMTMATLEQKLPSWDEIIDDPEGTRVEKSAAISCLLVLKAVQRIEADTLPAWMTYMSRMSKEAQGLFARSANSKNCPKRDIVTANRDFLQWLSKNIHLYTGE